MPYEEIHDPANTGANDTSTPVPTDPEVLTFASLPAISDIRWNSAILVFEFNEFASVITRNGVDGAILREEASTQWKSHVQTLSLSPSTTYNIVVYGTDIHGNTVNSASDIVTFTTSAAPAAGTVLPMGGQFYGSSATRGVTTANSATVYSPGIVFRAQATHDINAIGWENRRLHWVDIQDRRLLSNSVASIYQACYDAGFSTNDTGAKSCTLMFNPWQSYTVGNPEYLVKLVKCKTDRLPDTSPAGLLATSTSNYIPNDHATGNIVEKPLDSTVSLVEGEYYAILKINQHPAISTPKTASEASAFIAAGTKGGSSSNNGIVVGYEDALTGPFISPLYGDRGCMSVINHDTGDNWSWDDDHTPWWRVRDAATSKWWGMSYGGYDIISNSSRGFPVISGQTYRQVFTVNDVTRNVDRIWILLAYDQGKTPDGSNLSVVVKNNAGTTIATTSIAPNTALAAVNRGDSGTSAQLKYSADWMLANLSAAIDLTAGQTYSVEISCGSNSAFRLHTSYNGPAFQNVRDYNEWENAYVQRWNGSSWEVMSGDATRDMSMCFVITGKPARN